MSIELSLDSYRLLGRSGLRVSPLGLGTMTFGPEFGWGADSDEAQRIFEIYVDRGGNFIDTANQYTNGTAEELIGRFAADKRERLVIATKYTLPTRANDPNSGGNHRKSMVRSIELSLKRLMTEYIDLLYLHAWDATTSVEEILRAMDDLVRAGKVLYLGISDTVAWQISRMQAISDLRGWTPLVALQLEYNLIERTAERDLIPMAREMGLGVIPWSPLRGGILAGKYTPADLRSTGGSAESICARRDVLVAGGMLSARGLAITEAVKEIAMQIGRSAAQVALAWTLLTPGVISPIIGARRGKQLLENLGALDVELNETQRARLEAASAIELGFPHDLLAHPMMRSAMFGGVKIYDRQ